MTKTARELAFLRDLYITDDWTRRFADLADAHFPITDAENLLYINAGTGTHCFALRERIGDGINIFATCEADELLAIARNKAVALKSNVDFSRARFDDDAFDAVIADASLLRPEDLPSFFDDAVRVAKSGANVGVLTVTAGSFGEVFSLLWEVLYKEDLGEHGAAAERMITELPTISAVEKIATDAGLVNVKTNTANEIFEYDDGPTLINSPLFADFLFPGWLRTLSEDETERVKGSLAKLVDDEDGTLSFRFSLKATLVAGEKG
ncbi:MAG: class I SAM-dependent methyltransferase [Pyrinomonadaceae bacterium]